jgi:putative flippase GtrA
VQPDRITAQFLRFAIVGTVGFVVDAAVLYALIYGLGAGPYLGRLASFLAAASMTWLLNRRFTFPDTRRQPAHRQWTVFVAFMALGGLLNYGTYALVVTLAPDYPVTPLLAVAAGALAGLALNFTTSRLFVFGPGISRP